MFSLLEDREAIEKAQRKLEVTIGREFRKKARRNIRYPGDRTVGAEVRTDGRYWFWSADYDDVKSSSPRRLNWFGQLPEDVNRDLRISVEVNTPYEGRNDRVAGFFARDNDTGRVYLFHSGRVGGGAKGVGKSAFMAWGDQRPFEVFDSSGGCKEGVLVMPIEGFAATRPAVRYVEAIADFKEAVRLGTVNTSEVKKREHELKDLYKESRGRRKGKRSEEIDYVSRHGDVVECLDEWRKAVGIPKGGRPVKNILIDMGVEVGGKLVEVFEVKTSTARADVYSAIGQLMVHGARSDCRRVMVLPHGQPLAEDLKNALVRVGIEVMRFKLYPSYAKIVD